MRRGAILRALLGASVLAPILWYSLYRGTSAGGETFLIKVGLANDFTDLTVVNGTMYFYEVTAVNSVGEIERTLRDAEPSGHDAPVDAGRPEDGRRRDKPARAASGHPRPTPSAA
jgi:hypothetical protein